MKKAKTSLFSVVVLRVLIVTVTVWLLLMSLFTWAVAKDFYLQLENSTWRWVTSPVATQESVNRLFSVAEKMDYGFSLYPNTENLLPIFYDLLGDSYGSRDWFWGNWELMYGYQAAIQITDEALNISLCSGDYIFFEDEHHNSYYIDLSQVEGGKEFADENLSDTPYADRFPLSLDDVATFIGHLDGYRLYPTTIQSKYINQSFPVPDQSQDLCTINSPKGAKRLTYHYDPGASFRWKGKNYENAAQLLTEKKLESGFGLFGSVIHISARYNTGIATAAVYCNPLEQALLRTWHIWLITGVSISAFLILYTRKVRQCIITPLKIANQQYSFNNKALDISINTDIRELDLLGKHIDEAQMDRHDSHNRIQQLETALNYAQESEDNRRRLISALAHELKTPLAVIHGYAEGLQAGIAAEKESYYLSVLLEESEKMDSMVKEMLDYSRLEAGKVTLSTEQFSLSKMTSRIFDKFQISAQQQDLKVILDKMEDLMVTADKLRIQQVITNLVDNAIKYTPSGGSIRVLVYQKYGWAWFAIENDCENLPQDALEHLWDSFYRVDNARSSEGTGLGLAIVKSIVTLHRGSCYVQNTATGLRFSFRLPL